VSLAFACWRIYHLFSFPVRRWKVAIVQSPPIQSVLRNRIRAGMTRFSRTMREEWEKGRHDAFRAGEPSGTAR
jgi:hypothetical protein